jgi:hypothetical protein
VTHNTTVMNPVVVATQGTGYAHMAMTFGDGALWLQPWGSAILEVSPATGGVIRTVPGAPFPGGGHPAIAANGAGLWIAPGVGGPAVIERLAPGSTTRRQVYRASTPGAVLWLSAVEDRVWAEVVSFGPRGTYAGTRLVAFDTSGRNVLETGPEQFGDTALVGSGPQLWSTGTGVRCKGPQRLWSVSSRTGRAVATTILHSPTEPPCLAEGSPTAPNVAVVGRSVFVLDSIGPRPAPVLFRVSER